MSPVRLSGWLFSILCSAALTLITLSAPTVPGDWARLDAGGQYVPPAIDYNWPGYALQVLLWLGIVGGLGLAVGRTAAQARAGTRRHIPFEYIPLVMVTLLGFGLRLHTLGSLPLIIDEIGFAARASDILHGQHIPIFAPGHNGNPATFSWLLAGAMGLWEQNTFAMRLLSLACGTMCIPAAYGLGRTWWGRRAGVVVACFVAAYPAHVHFSRLALYNSVDPLFALLALAALERAVRRGSVADYVLVGALAGVAQYFYHGSRVLPVLIAVYVIMSRRGRITQVVMMTGAFALVAAPRFAPMFFGGLPLTGNLEGVRLPGDVVDNAVRSLLAWVGQPDVSPFWLSSAPLLPVTALLLALVGGWACSQRWRDARSVVLGLTLGLTTVFGGVIWPAAPLYVRYMTALPAIVLLVALGVDVAGRLLQRLIHQDRLQTTAVGCVTALVMLHGTLLSLQHPAEAYSQVSAGLWEEDRLAREAAALPAGEAAYFAVTSALGTVERITLADYVAAYGQRRAVSISPP